MPPDTPQPTRRLPGNALTLVLGLVALAVVAWLAITILKINVRHDMRPGEYHDVKDNGFTILLNDTELSVIYGIYSAVLLFAYGLLIAEKLAIVASAINRALFGLVAVALVLVPYIALNIHVDATYITVLDRPRTVGCGTWMHPTPIASGVRECISALDAKSRVALTTALAGMLAPFALVPFLVFLQKRKGSNTRSPDDQPS